VRFLPCFSIVLFVVVRDSKRTEEVTVRLGEFHFRWPSLSRRDHEVERIDIHEKFNPVRQYVSSRVIIKKYSEGHKNCKKKLDF
jgi:hypothetical protein